MVSTSEAIGGPKQPAAALVSVKVSYLSRPKKLRSWERGLWLVQTLALLLGAEYYLHLFDLPKRALVEDLRCRL